MSEHIEVSPLVARQFARAALALDNPHADVATALAYHGYVQIDPINICGRMHDLILRNRVSNYREGDLMRHLHGDTTPLPAKSRRAFEQHAPDTGNLAAFPLDAWPHLLASMRARAKRTSAWSGRLTPRERELAPRLLGLIRDRGPLGSEDFASEGRAHRVAWGAASLVKATLQKLFFHGQILIAQRANNRRRYDLPERVLPREVITQTQPTADATARWLILLKLRQRRLVLLKRDEVPWVADAVQPLKVAGCPTLYCLRTDLPLLEHTQRTGATSRQAGMRSAITADAPTTPLKVQLLAPLDPLIYDRRLTARLWDFEYTWEAYTPPSKRVRGYYALPVLAGTELVGHVDPKADRQSGRLRVVSRRIRRGHKAADSVRKLAHWLGLR